MNKKQHMIDYVFRDGKFSSVVDFKDGTPFSFNLSREEIEQFLRDNGKPHAISKDDDKLISNFFALAQHLHNRQIRAQKGEKPKPSDPDAPRTRGGKREGAGRKAKGGEEGTHRYSWRVSEEVWEILQQQLNKTDYIEKAILFYRKRGEL